MRMGSKNVSVHLRAVSSNGRLIYKSIVLLDRACYYHSRITFLITLTAPNNKTLSIISANHKHFYLSHQVL